MANKKGSVRKRNANGQVSDTAKIATIAGKNDIASTKDNSTQSSATTLNLVICVAGIYASLYEVSTSGENQLLIND